MSTKIIDISADQVDKLHFTKNIKGNKVREAVIEKKLKASLLHPVSRRQKMNIVFETSRGFFRIQSKLLSISNDFITLKGGDMLPINSIVKVV